MEEALVRSKRGRSQKATVGVKPMAVFIWRSRSSPTSSPSSLLRSAVATTDDGVLSPYCRRSRSEVKSQRALRA